MSDDLNIQFPPGEPLDSTVMERISAQLALPSKAVRPLPSNLILWLISIGIFAVVSFALASVVGLQAIAALSGAERAVYYGAVAIFACLFARAVIERMIPGEKRLVPSYALWAITLLVLGLLMALMFSDYSTVRFVARGVPCLRLGVISALISGVLGWRLLRRGYLVSPRETILLYCFFAGLVGVAVLALHCPIRNSMHCLVWHLGAMVLAGSVGLVLGKVLDVDG